MAESDKPNWPPPLDHEYTLKEDEIAFFKQESGITDDQALKEHILKVQSDAYAVSRKLKAIVVVLIVVSDLTDLSVPMHQTFRFRNVSSNFRLFLIHFSSSFGRLKISRYPFYKDVLKLGKERPGAILLDIGCCCMGVRS